MECKKVILTSTTTSTNYSATFSAFNLFNHKRYVYISLMKFKLQNKTTENILIYIYSLFFLIR